MLSWASRPVSFAGSYRQNGRFCLGPHWVAFTSRAEFAHLYDLARRLQRTGQSPAWESLRRSCGTVGLGRARLAALEGENTDAECRSRRTIAPSRARARA